MALQPTDKPLYIHATGVYLGGKGLLIQGPSRAGKSSLALALIERGGALSASLVGDDRIGLLRVPGLQMPGYDPSDRLVMQGHPLILGQIEKRGHGIIEVASRPSAGLHCVIELAAAPAANDSASPEAGFIEPSASTTRLLGVNLPLYRLPRAMDRAAFILETLLETPAALIP